MGSLLGDALMGSLLGGALMGSLLDGSSLEEGTAVVEDEVEGLTADRSDGWSVGLLLMLLSGPNWTSRTYFVDGVREMILQLWIYP
jgi:hypothetical protein